MSQYEPVPKEVTDLVQVIIMRHHPDLLEANIGVVFADAPGNRNGREVWAAVSTVSGKLQSAGLELDFLMWIALPVWERLPPRKREALVDHELMHCIRKAGGKFALQGHDFEGFRAEIQRHGIWREDLDLMAETIAEQLTLPGIQRQGKVVTVGHPGSNGFAVDAERLRQLEMELLDDEPGEDTAHVEQAGPSLVETTLTYNGKTVDFNDSAAAQGLIGEFVGQTLGKD